MDARTDLKRRLPGWVATEGPERAPHRSRHSSKGPTTRKAYRPGIGVSRACCVAAAIADLKPAGRRLAQDLGEPGRVLLSIKPQQVWRTSNGAAAGTTCHAAR